MASFYRYVVIISVILLTFLSTSTILLENSNNYNSTSKFTPTIPIISYSNTTLDIICNCNYIIINYLNEPITKQYYPMNSENNTNNFSIPILNHEEKIKITAIYTIPSNNTLITKSLVLTLPRPLLYTLTLINTNASIGISLTSNYVVNGSYSIISPNSSQPKFKFTNSNSFTGFYPITNIDVNYQMLLYFHDKFNRSISLVLLQNTSKSTISSERDWINSSSSPD